MTYQDNPREQEHYQAGDENMVLSSPTLQVVRGHEEQNYHMLNELFPQAPACIALLQGPDHRFVLANPLFCQTVGRQNVLGKTPDEIQPEVVSRRVRETLDLVYATGTSYIGKEVLVQIDRSGDGTLEESYFTFVYQPIRDASGHVESIFVHGVEITEHVRARKQVEQLPDQLQQKQVALKQVRRLATERASQLEAVLETITDVVLVLDRDEQVLFSNKAHRGLSDHMNLSVPGATFREQMKLFTPQAADGSPLPYDQWPILRALRGETFTGNDTIDIGFHVHQGEVRVLNTGGAPIRSDSGEIIGAVIVAREVTERRHQEQQTQGMLDTILNMIGVLEGGVTEKLRSFMEQPCGDSSLPPREKRSPVTYVAMQLATLTRQVLKCNRVCILRLDLQAQELHPLGVVGASLVHGEQWWADSPARRFAGWQLFDPSLFERLQQGEIVECDLSHLPRHDNPYAIRQTIFVPMFVQHRLVGLVGVNYDEAEHIYSPQEKALARGVAKLAALVIERQRLTQEQMEAQARELALQEVNRQKDAFLGIINHELKAPLTVISTSLQFAQHVLSNVMGDVVKDNDRVLGRLQKVEKLLTTAMQQVVVQTRMVHDLLDFSSMQANQLRLQKTWCDLVILIREVIEEQRRNVPMRTFHLDLAGYEYLALFADSDRIKQVLNNYLTNAIKYTPAEKPIDVCLNLQERMVRVQVHDEGPGLLPEEVQQVWDRWYQGQGVKQMTGKGMSLGIGLSVCQMIIKQHQGQVGVETAPGAGANFWFTLPLAE